MLVELGDSIVFDVFDPSTEVGKFCLELFALSFELFFVAELCFYRFGFIVGLLALTLETLDRRQND